jgi:hypothetical protein
MADAAFKLRVPEDLRHAIEKAAEQRGLTLTGEIVTRLRESLERETKMEGLFDDPNTFALGELVAATMAETGRSIAGAFIPPIPWYDQPFAYDQAVRAATFVLNELRPYGEISKTEIKLKGDKVGDMYGQTVVDDLLTDEGLFYYWTDRLREKLTRFLPRLRERGAKRIRGEGR